MCAFRELARWVNLRVASVTQGRQVLKSMRTGAIHRLSRSADHLLPNRGDDFSIIDFEKSEGAIYLKTVLKREKITFR